MTNVGINNPNWRNAHNKAQDEANASIEYCVCGKQKLNCFFTAKHEAESYVKEVTGGVSLLMARGVEAGFVYEQQRQAAEIQRDNIWLDSASAVHHVTNYGISGGVRYDPRIEKVKSVFGTGVTVSQSWLDQHF